MAEVFAKVVVVEQKVYARVIETAPSTGTVGNLFTSATAGEPIVSLSAVVVINGLAYKMDASNPAHANAFAGFAKIGVLTGETLIIQSAGIVEFAGWGLTQGSNYFAGLGGTITTAIVNGMAYSRMIGYAITADTMLIINSLSITLL